MPPSTFVMVKARRACRDVVLSGDIGSSSQALAPTLLRMWSCMRGPRRARWTWHLSLQLTPEEWKSLDLLRQLVSAATPHITSGRNDGFVSNAVVGAEGDWDWHIILNADATFDPDELASCRPQSALTRSIVHLDDESALHMRNLIVR